jgi:hypothetical protein
MLNRDDLRHIGTIPVGHAVLCRCLASEGRISPEHCDGLVVFNSRGRQVGIYRGRQYRAQTREDGRIVIVSTFPAANSEGEIRQCQAKEDPCRSHAQI